MLETVKYKPDMKVKNAHSLPSGTGCRYLICLIGDDCYIAKRWARIMPKALASGHVIIDMK